MEEKEEKERLRREAARAEALAREKQEQAEKASDIRGEVKEIGWGNQIRSYVMQPYKMVTAILKCFSYRNRIRCTTIQIFSTLIFNNR